jgi:RNA polymerase sigma-70 factor (ECF subfamily)
LRDRILAGERAAAETLLAEHLDPLSRFVRWRLGSDLHRVEDLVQDTFLAALEKIGAFDGRASLHTWLCSIAKNKIRSARRAEPPKSLEDVLEEADPDIDAILAEIAREPLPDSVLERKETRDLVGATLSSLPPDYAEALVQKYVEGRTVAQMAASRVRSAARTRPTDPKFTCAGTSRGVASSSDAEVRSKPDPISAPVIARHRIEEASRTAARPRTRTSWTFATPAGFGGPGAPRRKLHAANEPPMASRIAAAMRSGRQGDPGRVCVRAVIAVPRACWRYARKAGVGWTGS